MSKANPLYAEVRSFLTTSWSRHTITTNDGQYLAINNGKRFVSMNAEPGGNTYLKIREDGDTRTVYDGFIQSLNDFIKINYLTLSAGIDARELKHKEMMNLLLDAYKMVNYKDDLYIAALIQSGKALDQNDARNTLRAVRAFMANQKKPEEMPQSPKSGYIG